MPLAAGTRIGPYEIVSWIGAGGMGEVYRARDPRIGRDVAIKLLPPAFAGDSNRLHRFEQEARAVGQLNHPNILAIFDVGTQDGAPYIVSELLEGESLRSRLQQSALSARRAVDYARQTAEGLAAAHDKGIVHRDLKPDNLFITTDERIKILDFGIAKLTRPADDAGRTGLPTETDAGMVMGTQGYMSPEQVRGETVDPRSDLFSFGAILYEMLAGRPAFVRGTAAETMAAILKEDPPAAAWTDVSPGLERILARCLERSRDARYQSARDLAFGLEVLSSTGPAASVGRRAPRRWIAWAVVTAVILGAIGAASVWLMREPPSIDARLATATYTAITNGEATDLDAAISPDGRFVAFMSDREGPFHVWLTQVGAGGFRNLTPGAGDQRNPGGNRSVGFSGDGSEVWVSGSQGRARLRLLPLLGGEPKPFLGEQAVNAVWSHDGQQLAYFTYGPGDPILVADRKGANARQIYVGEQEASKRQHNHFLAWSPDDRWIYYAHGIQSTSEFDIWRIPAPGGTPERLTHTNSLVQYLTPIDSRWLLYIAPDRDKSGPWLWALDVTRAETHRVSTGLEKYTSIAADADGKRLVATVANSTAGLWSVPIGDRPAVEADVTAYRLNATRTSTPRFGAPGTLFYTASSGAADALWRSKDGKLVDVWRSTESTLPQPPAISRDGSRVALVTRKAGRQTLTLMSSDGTDAREFAPGLDVQGTIDWSPDGKWIVSGGNDAQGPGLFKIAVDTGTPVRLVPGAGFDPVWSPTRDLIVYTGPQTANAPLLAVRADGTTVTMPPIQVPFGGGVRGRSRFLPTGDGLVYVQGPVGEQNFWLLDLVSNKTRPLTQLKHSAMTYVFDISPDGQIVFDRVRENSAIRLIDLK